MYHANSAIAGREAVAGLSIFGLVCLGIFFPLAVGTVALEISEVALVVDVAVAIDHPIQDNWVTVGGGAVDVPRAGRETLLAWATTPFKALAGQVVFYSDHQARVPQEAISFAAGQCVHYGEDFDDGNTGPEAYTCDLTIAAPVFELHASGAGSCHDVP